MTQSTLPAEQHATLAEVSKRPTLQSLHSKPEMADAVGRFLELINKRPPAEWLKPHMTAKVKRNGQTVPALYLPIGKVEQLLRTIYQRWEWHVIDFKLMVNSVAVHGRLRVQDPVTLEWMEMDGVGAKKIIVKAGSNPTAVDNILPDAIEMVLPAAESMALKCAAQKLGKIFGGDLNRDTDAEEFVSKYAMQHADWTKEEAAK